MPRHPDPQIRRVIRFLAMVSCPLLPFVRRSTSSTKLPGSPMRRVRRAGMQGHTPI